MTYNVCQIGEETSIIDTTDILIDKLIKLAITSAH